MLLQVAHRILFYGAILAAFMAAGEAYFNDFTGSQLWLSFSIVSGIVALFHSANLAVVFKLTDMERNSQLGFWAHQRLVLRADKRRAVVHLRFVLGSILILGAGGIEAFMALHEQDLVPGWLVGLTAFTIIMSAVMGGISVYETYAISSFESALNRRNREEALKHSARLSINAHVDSKDDQS